MKLPPRPRSQVGDKRTMSEALRHLGIAEHRAGRLDTARQRLEESVRLRRDIGLMPGVAANLVGLAYIAAGDGDHDEALALLKEAGAIAEASGAHRITRQVEESRTAVARNCPRRPRSDYPVGVQDSRARSPMWSET